MRSRLRPSLIAASMWTLVAWAQARRIAKRGNLADGRVLPPPNLPEHAERAVLSVLRRTHASCLVRSLVLQAWESAHGRPVDVVVGVRRHEGAMEAHAWLDGDDVHETYQELVRRSHKDPGDAHNPASTPTPSQLPL